MMEEVSEEEQVFFVPFLFDASLLLLSHEALESLWN